MARSKAIDRILDSVLRAQPPRAGSMIVTVFGDSVSQHGNSVWLGSLIDALAPFGLNPRQIRTAVFRLVQDDWLSCAKLGRRSYYSFTDTGQRQFEKSARRIYAADHMNWAGQWTMVMPVFSAPEQREQLKRELGWLGFGAINSGTLAHPNADAASLAQTIHDLGLTDAVVCWRATTDQVASIAVLKKLAQQLWSLDELAQRFERFLTIFRPALDVLGGLNNVDDKQMFELQTLVIHEYRRILLKTTDLPDELLPANWPGRTSMDLTARLYRYTQQATARYLESSLEGPQGPLSKADEPYFERFVQRPDAIVSSEVR